MINNICSQWLDQQRKQQRQLVLIANPMAEPNPVPSLFTQALIRDYLKLYQGSEFDHLADLGPWLIRIDPSSMPALSVLMQTPQQHWGWVASAEHLDLNDIAAHWRARMIIHDDGQRAFYRLQDNRVIARHLQALEQQQIPLLLGPLCSALCWTGERWLAVDNPEPGARPEPFATPWLDVPQPESVADAVHCAQLEKWLWEDHLEATAQLQGRQPLAPWLHAQLHKAKNWNWLTEAQVHFLLEHQLDAELANHPAWTPRADEAADAHFLRVTREVSQALKAGKG